MLICPAGAFFKLPLGPQQGDLDVWRHEVVEQYATSNQLCATVQRGAMMEDLCAPRGSLASPVTRFVDER